MRRLVRRFREHLESQPSALIILTAGQPRAQGSKGALVTKARCHQHGPFGDPITALLELTKGCAPARRGLHAASLTQGLKQGVKGFHLCRVVGNREQVTHQSGHGRIHRRAAPHDESGDPFRGSVARQGQGPGGI